MERDFTKEEKYIRAKKKVKELKGFYWHLIIYIIINIFISTKQIIGYINAGETFLQALNHFNIYGVWLFWGVGIGSHALKTFGFNFIFGKDWEERKIKEFMD